MCFFFFLLIRLPTRSTRTETLCPCTTLVRSGAVVVKVSLDEIERGWAASKEDDVIVTDPHGVIFISSRPAWRYRSLAPLDAAARASLAETRRYESVDLRPLDLTFRSRGDDGPLMLTVAGDSSADKVREYIAVAKEMVDAGWTLHVLASTRLARRTEEPAVVVAVLAWALNLLPVTVTLPRRARPVEGSRSPRRRAGRPERPVGATGGAR